MRKERLFVLRLWRDGHSERDWRASLRDLRSQDTELFDSLERLLDFLKTLSAEDRRT